MYSGKLTFWETVLLGNYPSGKLSFWETTFWETILLGNFLLGKNPLGKILWEITSGKHPNTYASVLRRTRNITLELKG